MKLHRVMIRYTKSIMTNAFVMTMYVCLLSLLFASCGEDRTYEYEELTKHNIWIYDLMKESYLWSENLTEQSWKDYFSNPEDYFAKLAKRGQQDVWSYIDVDSLNIDHHARGYFHHSESYGFDFALVLDPTGLTTKSYARVLTVYDDSPAARAGLERNDFIETFDGYKLSKNNIYQLQKGLPRKYLVYKLRNTLDDPPYALTDSRIVEIEHSTFVEDKAFPVYDAINVGNKTVGYLMCNRLLERSLDTDRKDVDYSSQLDKIMYELRGYGLDEFVLDLRLCNFGSLDMACRLASYIVKDNVLGETFANTVWNDKLAENNVTLKYDTSLRGHTLNMSRVFVITSGYTQGAAEWLINSLRCTLGKDAVIIVGEKTAGQNVMTAHIGDYDDMLHIYPVVSNVTDASGNNDFRNGFVPDSVINEFNYDKLFNYGDPNEVLLNVVLRMM